MQSTNFGLHLISEDLVKRLIIILSVIFGIFVNSGYAQQTSFGVGAGYVQIFNPSAIGLNIHLDATSQITDSFGFQVAGDVIVGSRGTAILFSVKPLFFAELFSGSQFYVGPTTGVLLSSAGTAISLGLTIGSMSYIGDRILFFSQGEILLGGVLFLNVGVRLEL